MAQAKLHRCVRKVKAKGVKTSSAFPICIVSTGQKPIRKKRSKKK